MSLLMRLLGRTRNWIAQHGRRRRAIPLLALLSAADYFVPAMPTQISFAMLVYLQAGRRLWLVLAFALASVLGAAMLAASLWYAASQLQPFMPALNLAGQDFWLVWQGRLREHGGWVLLLLSMLPLSPRSLVITALLAGLSAPLVFGSVFVGKLCWFSLLLWLLLHAPRWLQHLPWLGPYMATLENTALRHTGVNTP